MIRAAAVAGTFYPADTKELDTLVESFLDAGAEAAFHPKALIVPHAGYIYSGVVAASAYCLLRNQRGIKRVVLIGPAHHIYLKGLALSSATHFVTPLGSVPVAEEVNRQLLGLPRVQVSDQAHLREHSLEVQLPFLQQVLGDFTLVPILVGDASSEETAQVIDQLWGGEETLLVVSSDLSHYHSYAESQKLDQQTSEAICSRSEKLVGEQACGCRAINGLMRSAKKRYLDVVELARCNSGDTAGDKSRVVGYGAYVLFE